MKFHLLIFFLLSLSSQINAYEENPETEIKKGPHGGKVLEQDHFKVEVTIYEPSGQPPKFRIYFYDKNQPIPPSKLKFEMQLKRLNREENIPFKQQGEFLESSVEAKEPHSFQVKINAEYQGKTYHWEYDSFEARVELTAEAIKANGIEVETAGPINLEVKLEVYGKIVPNEELTVYIIPRFPGMVQAVNKKLGDIVHKGDVLAVIESNDSLKNYELKSEINGMIIKKNINVGMYLTGQENVFVISDLSSVWADFNIYRQDISQVTAGDPVQVTSLDGSLSERALISYISPLGQESTQSVIARAVLPNPQGLWKTGLFITGEITTEKIPIAVAVKESALQPYRDWNVVFLNAGNLFEAAPIQIGRQNQGWVEVKSGLKSGDRYVSQNSFILKADLEKAGASHEH